MRLAIIGGTGAAGTALAARFARAGVEVILGSRDPARGTAAAEALNSRLALSTVSGTTNRAAAQQAGVVILALPYDGMRPILADVRDAVQGKTVISIASALSPARKSQAQTVPGGSICAEIQQFLGDGVRVVAALQHVAPERLEGDAPIDSDVLVCGADRATRDSIIELIEQIGLRALDAGPVANAIAVETFTAVLISLNIKYKVRGAGIRITGLPGA